MQGFNMGRYVPPDVEGTVSGNKLHGKHALGSRASKLRTDGTLTVRFEMPFGVWCGTCAQPTIIGQGVRFNAEKKKVGAYHSTPIWSFRMRHGACGGLIEIRTDPANAEYVVTEGGTRRDTGDDKDDSLVTSRHMIGVGGVGFGEMGIQTAKEKEALRNDAFARLEKTIEDRAVLIERSHRIAELADASHRAWEDPYARNMRLRAAFRAGRKAREKELAGTEELKDRMSLGIDLVPATQEDARRAALVDFGVGAALDVGDPDDTDDVEEDKVREARVKDSALAKPLFATASTAMGVNASSKTDSKGEQQKGSKKRLKAEIKASQTRTSLATTVSRNTRASHDPFLVSSTLSPETGMTPKSSRIQGIKRKRVGGDADVPVAAAAASASASPPLNKPSREAQDEKGEEGGRGQAKSENPDGETTSTRAERKQDSITPTPTLSPPDTEVLPDPGPPKAALVDYDSD